jgi:hypothetical protein
MPMNKMNEIIAILFMSILRLANIQLVGRAFPHARLPFRSDPRRYANSSRKANDDAAGGWDSCRGPVSFQCRNVFFEFCVECR